MSAPGFQTVRLAKGSHASPEHGACVIELSSMLAGEPFSDHPRTVCPVIAGFLRTYNDLLPDSERDGLYPCAALVVGSAATRAVRRRRTLRLLEWAGIRDPARPPRRFTPLPARDQTVVAAAHAAFRLAPGRRRTAVPDLLQELVAIGRAPTEAPANDALAAPESTGPAGAEDLALSRR